MLAVYPGPGRTRGRALRFARLASTAAAGAAMGAMLPIIALLILSPSEYGLFSTIYLFFAYGVSLQYSVISEAWARARKVANLGAGWQDYAVALGSLALVVAAGATATSWLIPELRSLCALLGLAVLLGVYRSGARYYWAAQGASRRVLISDLLGIAAMFVVLGLFHDAAGLLLISASWSVSVAASAVALGLPGLHRSAGPFAWVRRHASEIKPLLMDSTLMDVGAVGTPFLLVGSMGAEKFGIYRGISSAAMPVRLLVDPLRPALGNLPSEFLFRTKPAVIVWTLALLIGGVSYCVLEWLVPSLPFRMGTLSELVAYAEPAAIFAASNFIGHVFYVVSRTNLNSRTLMSGRIFQTIVVVVMPVLGFLLQGLSGAIWGFAVSAAASALIWVYLNSSNRSVDGTQRVTRPDQIRVSQD
jgi:hypothetical protein